jgi:hypothetical protein
MRIIEPLGEGSLYAAHPMAWGTYLLRSSFVSVFIRLRVKARHHEEQREYKKFV